MLLFVEPLVNQGQWPIFMEIEDTKDYENNGGHERYIQA